MENRKEKNGWIESASRSKREGVRKRRGGGSKGDETVGVCNCSGFNALLMADGTRDWGNGLHQMSLLARERRRRGNPRRKRGKRYSGKTRSKRAT